MNQELPDEEILYVPSLWEQRCMLRLAQILDGVVAEFVIRGTRQSSDGGQSASDKWRVHAGGLLFLIASILKDADCHSLEDIAAQAGQVAFRRIREKGLDPLDEKSVLLHLEKESKLVASREIQLQLNQQWTANKKAKPNKEKSVRGDGNPKAKPGPKPKGTPQKVVSQ